MELVAFVETGGRLRDVVVLPLRPPEEPEPASPQQLFEAQKAAIAPLHTFEVANATCHLPSDMDMLLAAIESGFGSHTAFNIKVRRHGQSALPWQCLSSAPAPLQAAPGGSVQLGTPKAGPGSWDPSHDPRCSS